MSDFRIALPRAINLGSHKKVSMADLRALAEAMGFEDVKTILNSGNLVFRSDLKATSLEQMLETGAERELGLSTEFFVRTPAEWKKIVANNPFPKEAKSEPARLMVHFCRKIPAKLEIKGQKQEKVKPHDREVYAFYPDGIGTSRLKLNVVGTVRNWNTVLKLANLLRS
jgi:uncharacterized protein (DUF1697 family)